MLSIIFLIIATIIVAIGFYYYKSYKQKMELEKKEEERKRLMIERFFEEKERLSRENNPTRYELQTHDVKYSLYDPYQNLSYELFISYKNIIHDNLWINEPFHSKFYETLLVLDNNDFMIIDSNYEAMTIYVRDKNNKETASNSFEVFDTKKIIDATLFDAMREILFFEKIEAQNIVLAICMFALERSLYHTSKEIPKKAIDYLLQDYEYADIVKYIINKIKYKDINYMFVRDAFKIAYNRVETQSYNDSEKQTSLYFPTKLPEKKLTYIK